MTILTRLRAVHWIRLAEVVVLVALFIAALEVHSAAREFRANQDQRDELSDSDHEARAVDLFLKYRETIKGIPARPKGTGTDAAWRHHVTIGITESIWSLMGDDAEWSATVKWMVTNEEAAQQIDDLDCSTYSDEFVQFMVDAVGHDVCVPDSSSDAPAAKPTANS